MQLADRQITVAVVDDDPLFLEYLVARMSGEREINLFTARTGDELFDVLRQRPVDCLVLDYDLGEETGLALAARVKRDIPDPPPVVMAASTGSERTAIKDFRGGFSDYVAKQNLAVSELLNAVREAVARHRRERTATADIERARRESKFDAITGLYGQRFIEDRLRELTDDDSGREFALIALKPRDFDQIVRTHGTVTGDAILRELGRNLRADTRDSDIRGRWDSAAFLYIVEHFDTAAAVLSFCSILADRVTFDFNTDKATLNVSCDIGAAMCPINGADHLTLMESAFNAMHRCGTMHARFEADFAPDGVGADSPPRHASIPRAGEPPAEGRRATDRIEQASGGIAIARTPNRRVEPRRRVLKRGQISVDGLHTTIDCIVRSLSRSGAMLRFEGYFAPPERFLLRFTGSNLTHEAELRWQIGNDVGVRFRDPLPAGGAE